MYLGSFYFLITEKFCNFAPFFAHCVHASVLKMCIIVTKQPNKL